MTKITTNALAEIESEIYESMGLSEETDEHSDELIATELAASEIEVDEDHTPSHSDLVYAKQAVRRALKAWSAEATA